MEDANLCSTHAKHVTIMPNNIQLDHHIHGSSVSASVVVGCVWVTSMWEGGSNSYVIRF